MWFWHYGKDTAASQEMLTVTPQGIPGDPINVGLVGSKSDVLHAFAAAKWDPADADHTAQQYRDRRERCARSPRP